LISATIGDSGKRLAYWLRLIAGLFCVAVTLRAIVTLTARTLTRNAIWTDFAVFHVTVNRWLDGLPMYGTNLPMFGAPRLPEPINFNPPQFHLLVLPFARLNLGPALLLWIACSLVIIGICAAIVVRTLRLRWSLFPAVVAIAMVVNSAALSSTLWLGQMSPVLALPVTLAWRAHRLGRWNTVGAWMGLAASIKPFLLIVFPYLLFKRQWRACLYGALAWVASFTVGGAVFGHATLEHWVHAAQWPTWQANLLNASFQGYVGRVMLEWPAQHVATIGSALGVLATIWLARLRDPEVAWALLMTGALLWAPLGWVYYVWFLMPPIAALVVERRLPPAAWLLAIPFVWPINASPIRITGTFLDAQVMLSIYFWGLLAFWLLLSSSAITSSRTSSCSTGTSETTCRATRRP
jgi:glycosyl transferase family 87